MIAQTAAQASAVRAHEELYAYWASRRRGSELPGRRDIDPIGFKRLLPTVSLVDVRGDPPSFRLRLAGTGLFGVFGREITGLTLDQVYPASEAVAWRERLEKVARTGKPAVGVSSLAWRGVARTSLVWIRLPLASDGKRVDMILGYDAVIGLRDEPPSGVRAA
jgi:hypothetical protein